MMVFRSMKWGFFVAWNNGYRSMKWWFFVAWNNGHRSMKWWFFVAWNDGFSLHEMMGFKIPDPTPTSWIRSPTGKKVHTHIYANWKLHCKKKRRKEEKWFWAKTIKGTVHRFYMEPWGIVSSSEIQFILTFFIFSRFSKIVFFTVSRTPM